MIMAIFFYDVGHIGVGARGRKLVNITFNECWEHVTYFVITERRALWELPRLRIYSLLCIKKKFWVSFPSMGRGKCIASPFSNTGALRSPICSESLRRFPASTKHCLPPFSFLSFCVAFSQFLNPLCVVTRRGQSRGQPHFLLVLPKIQLTWDGSWKLWVMTEWAPGKTQKTAQHWILYKPALFSKVSVSTCCEIFSVYEVSFPYFLVPTIFWVISLLIPFYLLSPLHFPPPPYWLLQATSPFPFWIFFFNPTFFTCWLILDLKIAAD